MKLKICGMKHNIIEVAQLQPEYMGFIFHEASSRHFTGTIPDLPNTIKKVGVFVNRKVEFIVEHVEKFQLDAIQLHGDESPSTCELLQSTKKTIIKVFSINNEFDFSVIRPYEDVCDYFLFDTKGKLPGGNGYTFDWSILKDYPSTKPYFLSGGIGPKTLEHLNNFFMTKASAYCYAIDVNSKFEEAPGLKKINELEQFQHELQH